MYYHKTDVVNMAPGILDKISSSQPAHPSTIFMGREHVAAHTSPHKSAADPGFDLRGMWTFFNLWGRKSLKVFNVWGRKSLKVLTVYV